MRTVAHVDMNAFFAAVEQRRNPALRGRPIAVCGSGKRTVITAASYEAKAFGVKAGMYPAQALSICPGLLLVEGDSRLYTDFSRRIISIFRRFSPQVEVFSIDEAFIDLTHTAPLPDRAREAAALIKKDLMAETGLTCSIGLSCNKLLAKLGSDLQKPDGLVVITPQSAPALLEELPVDSLCGIGPSTRAALHALGIRHCGELGRYPRDLLRRRFGVNGERIRLMALGLDDSPVVPLEETPEALSFGHSITLPRNIEDGRSLLDYLLQLSQAVGRRLRGDGAAGHTVTLTVRYPDFETVSRRSSFRHPVSFSGEIYRAAREIFETMQHQRPVRLIGVSVSHITRCRQIPLFEDERRAAAAQQAMDRINDIYGERAIAWGMPVSLKDSRREPISPSWRPS